MTLPVLLVADHFPDTFLQAIAASGWDVRYLPGKTLPEYHQAIGDCAGLLLNSAVRVDAELLNLAPALRLVLRAGVGADHIDEQILNQRNIRFVNTPGANAAAVGEMAMGLLLNLLRNIPRADREVRNSMWKREANRGVELSALTVGIYGFGNTGMAFARMLSGSACNLFAYDKYKTGFGNERIAEVNPDRLFQEADVISFHVPLTPETRYLGNEAFFRQFRKPVYLLNLSRGPVVQTACLPDLLDSGTILGAGLDVLEEENLNNLSPELSRLYQNLFARENVLFTPHIGGWTFTAAENIQSCLLRALQDFTQS